MKKLSTKGKILITLSMTCLLFIVTVVTVYAASSQTVYGNTMVRFQVTEDIKARINTFGRLYSNNSTFTAVNPSSGCLNDGSYYAIVSPNNNAPIIGFSSSSLRIVDGGQLISMPNGDYSASTFLYFEFEIVCIGEKNIRITTASISSVFSICYAYNLGSGRYLQNSSDNGFVVLSDTYIDNNGTPASNTGSAIGSGSVGVYIYLTSANVSSNISNTNIQIPISLQAWDLGSFSA